jgi:hypothetical protein
MVKILPLLSKETLSPLRRPPKYKRSNKVISAATHLTIKENDVENYFPLFSEDLHPLINQLRANSTPSANKM